MKLGTWIATGWLCECGYRNQHYREYAMCMNCGREIASWCKLVYRNEKTGEEREAFSSTPPRG